MRISPSPCRTARCRNFRPPPPTRTRHDEILDRLCGDGRQEIAVAVMAEGQGEPPACRRRRSPARRPRSSGDSRPRRSRPPSPRRRAGHGGRRRAARRGPPAVRCGSNPASSTVAPTISRPSAFGARWTSAVQTTCSIGRPRLPPAPARPRAGRARKASDWPFRGRSGRRRCSGSRPSDPATAPVAITTVSARQSRPSTTTPTIRPPTLSRRSTVAPSTSRGARRKSHLTQRREHARRVDLMVARTEDPGRDGGAQARFKVAHGRTHHPAGVEPGRDLKTIAGAQALDLVAADRDDERPLRAIVDRESGLGFERVAERRPQIETLAGEPEQGIAAGLVLGPGRQHPGRGRTRSAAHRAGVEDRDRARPRRASRQPTISPMTPPPTIAMSTRAGTSATRAAGRVSERARV